MRQWLVALRGNSTQKEIADKLGITQQYYSYIESGERQKKMDVQICEKLAQIFGISISEIIRLELEHA
nr:MAG TPA: Helix-turn-helix XRE-family like protein [Caudoviricetes sp.]